MLTLREIEVTISDEWVEYIDVDRPEYIAGSIHSSNFPDAPSIGDIYYLILEGSFVRGLAKKLYDK